MIFSKIAKGRLYPYNKTDLNKVEAMAHTVHRIDVTKEDVFNDLEQLAGLSHTTVDEFATSILAQYISVQKWQIDEIHKAKAIADQGGPFVAHEDVATWVNSWGTETELSAPTADIFTK